MAEEKTREELEEEWWKRWHGEDFTWKGLEDKPLFGWVVAHGFLREAATGRFYGKPAPKVPVRVAGQSANLQHYWSADPASGALRGIADMADELVLIDGQHTYHKVHLPLVYEDGTATLKAGWRPDALDAIVIARLLAAVDTGLPTEDFQENPNGADLRAQFQGGVWLKATSHSRGVEFPLRIRIELAYFAGSACFIGANFWGKVSFDRVVFSGSANFRGANFRSDASFLEARFSMITNFSGANFFGDTYFQTASFLNYAEFKAVVFSNVANFHGVYLSDCVDFEGSVFSKKATFDKANFAKKTSFTGATFRGCASFDEAKFWGLGNFENAAFEANCRFSNSEFKVGGNFGATCLKAPNFVGATLHPAVSFRGLTMTGLGRAAFNIQWHAIAPAVFVFTLIYLLLWGDNPFRSLWVPIGAIVFLSAGVIRWIWWTLSGSADFLTQSKFDPRDEEDCARTLVKVSAENRNHLDEARFFRHQLKAQRLELPNGWKDIRVRPGTWLIAKPAEKSIGMIYELVSDYGLSFLRPVFALLTLVLANAVLLWAWEGGGLRSQQMPTSFQRVEAGFDARFLEAVSYSASRAFPFGPWGEIKAPENEQDGPQSIPAEGCAFAARILAVGPCRPDGVSLETPAALEGHRLLVRTLGLIQSLLTIVLVFLFGLALRRRFQIS